MNRKIIQIAGIQASRKEWIEIKLFGQEKAKGKLREVFQLELSSVTGGESVSIEAYSVDCISQIRNEHVELRKMDYSHLKGLWFSDACKDKEISDIEVLI